MNPGVYSCTNRYRHIHAALRRTSVLYCAIILSHSFMHTCLHKHI